MPKEKNFTAQTVRVPRAIEKPLGYRMVDTGESFQAMVLRLLREDLEKSIPSSGESAITEKGSTNDPSVTLKLPGTKTEQISEEEWRWVHRVLKIVRGGRPEALVPLDTNLDAFTLVTDLLTSSTTSATSPGDHVSATPVSTAAVDIQRKMGALRAAQEALGHELDAAQRASGPARRPGKHLRGA